MPLNPRLPADIGARLTTLGPVLGRECPAVEFCYLFGSSTRGQLTARSDIDIAVFLSADTDLHHQRLDVARIAAQHLATDAIDVVLLNTAPIAVAGRILTDRQVIVDRHPFRRHEYESRTARLYQDFRIREHRILTHRYARG